jgi:hypothetical protein
MLPVLLRTVLLASFAVVIASACGGPGAPRAAPVPVREVGAFVVRLGSDTVAVEEFARTADRVEGRQVVRTPRTSIRDYEATLDSDGAMRHFRIEMRDAPGAAPSVRATIEFGADTAVVRVTRNGNEQTHRIAAPAGSIPFLSYSVALYELPFASLRDAEGQELQLAMVPLGGAQPLPLRLEGHGTDSVIVHNIAVASRARVDQTGRLLAWDGVGSTLALTADREVALDLERFAREFAARDAAGAGLGTLSPRDSLVAQLGGATVSVAYGRPAARGRQIFGNVVPWGEVWRTGANQATVLRTDRDLTIGGTPVPAGSYTLFTLPAADGWQLIVNRQADQWGTQHDPAQDLARIPMRRESLAERVEQFTISLEDQGGGRGVLHLAWDNTRASVPVQVR